MHLQKKILLIILDGLGLRESQDYNAVANAYKPNWNYYTTHYAYGAIDASGKAVGLPCGQFGNSEVGHMNIGAGRIVEQDITRINQAIYDGSFFSNKVLRTCAEDTTSGNVHVLGLLSDGGVHSHIQHIFALIKFFSMADNIKCIWIHAFLDGRDTPPQSAANYFKQLEQVLANYPKAKIATVGGRYYAMDRDKRYVRLEPAYRAIIEAQAPCHYVRVFDALNAAYANGVYDEFVKPCIIGDYSGCQNGDSIVFANFRSDRAIQLTDAIISPEFNAFIRPKITLSAFITMTSYSPEFKAAVIFAMQRVDDTLGQYIASLGLRQLRIAETEKYPHVTYFFNAGEVGAYPNEERIMVASPKDVATYDLKPEMSLPEVTDKLITAIRLNKYDFIITNFANGDMVGHSGKLSAAVEAVNALDVALGKVIPEMLALGGEILIIADHGNCEQMYDYAAKQPHTQHTTNLVPCLYIGRKARVKGGGALQDIAPTLLAMSGLSQPKAMTGRNLLEFLD